MNYSTFRSGEVHPSALSPRFIRICLYPIYLQSAVSNEAIAYAEDEGQVILHYSHNDKLVVVEILDFKRFMSDKAITELLVS